MTNTAFSALLFGGSITAGLLGSLTGLGGGLVIIPLLTIGFGVDIRYAIGASLVSVIACSSGSAGAYVRDGFSNIRIGLLLEIATCLGALVGAAIATSIPASGLAFLFGCVLLFSAFAPGQAKQPAGDQVQDPAAIGARWGLNGSYPAANGTPLNYEVKRVPLGFGMMGVAGLLSGLLGIGSGAVKVLAMDLAMGLPFKVSTTTSNFMIGVTAAASASVYLHRGYIDPAIVMPVMLGVVAGSMAGARLLVRARSESLRRLFRVVVFGLSLEMIYSGITGEIR